jgi:hypothetical protein
MVGLDSMGGVLVSLLLKYTSSTLKNFAAPFGIILNCLFMRYGGRSGNRKPPSKEFIRGALLVILAFGTYTVA